MYRLVPPSHRLVPSRRRLARSLAKMARYFRSAWTWATSPHTSMTASQSSAISEEMLINGVPRDWIGIRSGNQFKADNAFPCIGLGCRQRGEFHPAVDLTPVVSARPVVCGPPRPRIAILSDTRDVCTAEGGSTRQARRRRLARAPPPRTCHVRIRSDDGWEQQQPPGS